jgi:GNAT superfamily N-acetyltransferase
LSGIAVRAYEAGDGDVLIDVHRRAILAVPDSFYSLAERQSWSSGLTAAFYAPKDGEVMELALSDTGMAIGFCHNTADEVLGLYVDPDWHGRGAGRTLLQRAEAMMIGRGHSLAHVKSTTSARPFYERYGYRFVADYPHKTRGGLVLPAVALEKELF